MALILLFTRMVSSRGEIKLKAMLGLIPIARRASLPALQVGHPFLPLPHTQLGIPYETSCVIHWIEVFPLQSIVHN